MARRDEESRRGGVDPDLPLPVALHAPGPPDVVLLCASDDARRQGV
jgi:hypothetical protein